MSTESQDKTTQNWLREVQKGYIRIGVLILLSRKPSHGYEIMKEIDSRTKGFWQPTAGGVYPVLRNLEKSGYIKGHWETQKNRKLKVYKMTQPGEAILKNAIVKQAEISNNINSLFQEFTRDVLNVTATDTSLLSLSSLFTPFLEEKATPRTLEQLEHEKKHIRDALKTMKERLKQIDCIIAELKKTANTSQFAHK